MPIVALSLDDMMNYKATLTGGAVAAAAQLAHLTSSSKQKAGVSQSRQVQVCCCSWVVSFVTIWSGDVMAA